jgi:hypothetical protein
VVVGNLVVGPLRPPKGSGSGERAMSRGFENEGVVLPSIGNACSTLHVTCYIHHNFPLLASKTEMGQVTAMSLIFRN